MMCVIVCRWVGGDEVSFDSLSLWVMFCSMNSNKPMLSFNPSILSLLSKIFFICSTDW